MTSKTPLSRLLAREELENESQTENNAEEPRKRGKLGSFFETIPQSSLFDKSAGSCLLLDELELMAELPSKSFNECRELLNSVAEIIIPESRTSLELLREPKYVATGLEELDQILQGGLKAGHVTELVGRAGVGKSQFCITVSARIAQAGKGVIYIDAERKVPAERLTDLIFEFGGSDEDATRVMVMQNEMRSCNELIGTLKSVENLMSAKQVGLLVIDSIAAVARSDNIPIHERQLLLARLAAELKSFAETYQIPVLVTNQVMGSVEASDQERLKPALGITWHHGVNVRLYLSSSGSKERERSIKISKSSEAEETEVKFVIDPKQGITGVSEVDPVGEDDTKKRADALKEIQGLSNELMAWLTGH